MRERFAVVNADVRTMETGSARAEAILVEAGRFRAVGEERTVLSKARRAGLPVLDAKGRLLLPGLIDSHTHLVHQGLLGARVDLQGTTRLEQALGRVRRALRTHAGPGPLMAERWDESRWRERRFPTREDIDHIDRDRPIILRRVDGHTAVGNTAACRLVAPQLPGVDAETGLFLEDASLRLNEIFPTPVAEAVAALDAAQDVALRLGVTTVHDFVVPGYLRAFQRLHRQGKLRIRAHVSLYAQFAAGLGAAGIEGGIGDDRFRLEGVKTFGDGSIGAGTAAFAQPYASSDHGCGRLNHTDEELSRVVAAASEIHLRTSVHAIGDAAIDQALRSFRSAWRRGRAPPPRIEHFECPTPEAVDEAAQRGVIASMQPNFVGAWAARGGLYEARLGRGRARRSNGFRAMARKGLPIAFGSDCMPFDPWFGIQACATSREAAQRLSPDEALRNYTWGSAQALSRPDLGRIRVGALADFILVDVDLKRPRDIGDAKVQATFVGGRPESSKKPPRWA